MLTPPAVILSDSEGSYGDAEKCCCRIGKTNAACMASPQDPSLSLRMTVKVFINSDST